MSNAQLSDHSRAPEPNHTPTPSAEGVTLRAFLQLGGLAFLPRRESTTQAQGSVPATNEAARVGSVRGSEVPGGTGQELSTAEFQFPSTNWPMLALAGSVGAAAAGLATRYFLRDSATQRGVEIGIELGRLLEVASQLSAELTSLKEKQAAGDLQESTPTRWNMLEAQRFTERVEALDTIFERASEAVKHCTFANSPEELYARSVYLHTARSKLEELKRSQCIPHTGNERYLWGMAESVQLNLATERLEQPLTLTHTRKYVRCFQSACEALLTELSRIEDLTKAHNLELLCEIDPQPQPVLPSSSSGSVEVER